MLRFFITFIALVFTCSYCAASLPLDEKHFNKALNRFCKKTVKKYDSLVLPTSKQPLKVPLALKYDHIETAKGMRVTYLYAITREVIPGKENSINNIIEKNVGRIVLNEVPANAKPDGQFSLHYIEIFEEFKKGGYGGAALDLTIMLSQYLAKKSDYYRVLKLQCADYDGEKYLGNIPYRLSIYLNRGFDLNQKCASLLSYLDLTFFLERINSDQLSSFVEYYIPELADDPIDYPQLLRDLRESCPRRTHSFAELLQIAESSSSDASQRILDRLFYDTLVSEHDFNTVYPEFLYALELDVTKWQAAMEKRKTTLAERTRTLRFNQTEDEELIAMIKRLKKCVTAPVVKRGPEVELIQIEEKSKKAKFAPEFKYVTAIDNLNLE